MIADIRVRSALSAAIGRPRAIAASTAARFDARVSPGAGTAASDDAPPEISATRTPSGSTAAARASAARPARSLAASGRGWLATVSDQPGATRPAPGAITSPSAITAAPRAIAIAALPIAIPTGARPPRSIAASAAATRRAGSIAATVSSTSRRSRARAALIAPRAAPR